MLLLKQLSRRDATAARLIGLVLSAWTIIGSDEPPALHGRGLVVLVFLTVYVGAWLVWTFWSSQRSTMTVDLYVLSFASAFLTAAAPSSAASVGAFVTAMAAAVRVDLRPAFRVVAAGVIALGVAAFIYHWSGIGVLAYGAGWCAMAFAGANSGRWRCGLSRRSCCSPRPNALTRSSCARRAWRSRRG